MARLQRYFQIWNATVNFISNVDQFGHETYFIICEFFEKREYKIFENQNQSAFMLKK